MKVFVINLKNSSDRREAIGKQLGELDIDYELFEAVYGATLTEDQFSNLYNDKWAKRIVGRHMLPGEIGCALSHLGVYQKIVDNELPFALVLEDDAQLESSIKPILTALERKLNPSDGVICILSGCDGTDRTLVSLTDKHSYGRINSAAYLTHAYVISLEGARRLIKYMLPVVQVADDWSWISRNTNVIIYSCVPPVANQADSEASGSTISGAGEIRGENTTKRWKRWGWWKDKVYYKWWKTVDRLGLGYSFWRQR